MNSCKILYSFLDSIHLILSKYIYMYQCIWAAQNYFFHDYVTCNSDLLIMPTVSVAISLSWKKYNQVTWQWMPIRMLMLSESNTNSNTNMKLIGRLFLLCTVPWKNPDCKETLDLPKDEACQDNNCSEFL